MPTRVNSGLARRTVEGALAMGKRLDSLLDAARFDGWANLLTGLGGATDKRMFGRVRQDPILSDRQGMAMFHHEWLARKLCEIVPKKAMRGGYELVVKGDEGERTRAVHDRVEELDLWSKCREAAIWARAAGGGGAVLLGIQDGGRVDQPVNEAAIQAVQYAVTVDRRSLQIARWYEDPSSPKFAQPELYRLGRTVSGNSSARTEGDQAQGSLWHESRMIVFPGALTGDEEKVSNNGWDYSILQAPYDVLRDFGVSWAAAATLLQEASQGVYKVANLTNILAAEEGEERLRKRFRAIEMCKSVARALLVDAELEDYTRVPVQFTGIPDTLGQLSNLLAAATDIPVTILMGQAPAGLNATGESDLLTWQGTIEDWQEEVLDCRWERVIKLLLLEGGQQEPESWKVKFAFAAPETPLQNATRRKLVADTDVAYVNAGVVLAEEVGLSRFAAEGWSAETQIDLDLRRKLDEIKGEKLLEEAENPPTPVVDPNADPNTQDAPPVKDPKANG